MEKLKNNKLLFIFLFVSIALLSYVFISYGQFVATAPATSRSGVNGTVVTVDDEKADLYYYNSLNYTKTNGSLPTGADQNIYNTNNMVKVKINYYGRDFYDTNLVGTVSTTENYNTYIYYHWYPVENGKVKIPLIDNPFAKRPTGKGFNSWISDSQGVSVYLDKDTYERYALVTPTSNGNGYADIEVSFYAHWINAKEGNTSEGWSTVFGRFDTGELHAITTTHQVCVRPTSLSEVVMNGYYLAAHANRYSYYTGYYVSGGRIRTANNRYCNTNGGCNYWTVISNGALYNSNTTYYRENDAGNNFTVATDAYILEHAADVCHDEDLYSSTSVMAGYYTPAGNIARYASIEGLYDDEGYIQSGTCNTNGGCNDLYRYLDKYDSNGNINYFQTGRRYYYLATRDTNIAHLNTSNLTSNWGTGSTYNKPFTFTGILANGTQSTNRWTTGASISLVNDTTIEHMTISSGTDYSSADMNNSRLLNATYHNLKVGRGLSKYNDYVNFNGLIGGNASTGSSSSNTRYKLIIESGYYNNTSVTEPTNRYDYDNLYIQAEAIFGNDLDRVRENNDNLEVYYEATASWAGNIYSANDSAVMQIIKSGKFGTSKADMYTGVYVGGVLDGTYNAARSAKIEGGWIYNLIGGPLTSSSRRTVNDTYIYMTGGDVDLIVGGAGRSSTYGNRIISVTGGNVKYSILGGSNGNISNTSDGDGTLYGSSFIYVGGDAVIGDTTLASGSNMYGVNPGNVFGNGNGKSGYLGIGSNDNSYIVINENCTINDSIYGGGNYGVTGVSSGNSTAESKITILNGSIQGSVYGGGNQNKVEDYNVATNAIINMSGGTVSGNVYGGANTSGIVTGGTSVNITGGTVTGSVYGGGKGSNTYVKRASDVTIGTLNTTGPTIGSVYGGSAFGTVNSASVTTTESTYKTTVNVNSGTITNVYGGGQGDATQEPCVAGDITVNINGGTSTNVFGGNNAKGTPVGDVVVNINNGTATNVYGGNNVGGTTPITHVNMAGGTVTALYGGGKETTTATTNVNITGGTTANAYGGGQSADVTTKSNITLTSGTITEAIYGGSNQTGTVKESLVNINSSVPTVYGGNNAGGTTTTSNVNINSGTITTVYGGGKEAATGTTNVDITGGTTANAYGGGQSADVTTKSNITLTSGTITGAIYGGSNQRGTVQESLVNINANVPTVYGGNNAGGTTTTTNVNLNSGSITTAYGGGNNAQTTTSNITLRGATVGSLFGGGNSAGVGTTNVNLLSGTATDVYGGSNSAGTVTQSNVTTNNASNLTVTSVYGGNNAGGKTVDTALNLVGGTYTNIYGGGNNAETDYTTVYVNGINVTGDFFGGGNSAAVNYNTNVNFVSSTIAGDIFGGGNLGEVLGNSTVKISGSTVNGSAYAGGNGVSAIVYGNTDITVHNSSTVNEHVFGGGNAANTGTQNSNSSTSHVNIAGATIHGNVYGGANTAVLYGTAIVNVGYSANNIVQSNIQIDGTVFGGGEANASGSPIYDFNFIGVTRAIEVNIDGAGYNNFNIDGSIFGSGNASSTSGTSVINISNYGTFTNYKENVSIQRTDTLTIKNSAIKLEGAKDRTNEFSDVEFTLSRIDKLVLANDSTLFLDVGVNLLKSFYSQKITGNTAEKASANITDSGSMTRNVNNRIYMYEGKNLNIATNEQASAYGRVSGMTFFGMYKVGSNGRVITALYDNAYGNGDEASSVLYAFTSGSYVVGSHHSNHNIKVDGFYSNFADKDNDGHIKVAYIEPSPPEGEFYRWLIGEQVATYDITLTASKYATLGTYELPLDYSNNPNTTFQILGFNYEDLETGFQLVEESQIPRVNNEGTADTKMGLKFEPSNTGFVTSGSTSFVTNSSNPVLGTKKYTSENSTAVPKLLFYFYHSKNITLSREIGTVIISMETSTPIDELNDEVNRVNINVKLTSALYNNNDYEGAMTSGEKYNMFASSPTNINTKSMFSAYYSLFMNTENSYYRTGYHHSLLSNYVFPENTKITMLDLIDNETYYYIVDSATVARTTSEYNLDGECYYELANFIKMGSTSTNNNYNESQNVAKYYNSTAGTVEEEFIFIVNFEDTEIAGNQLNNTLFMDLRNAQNNTLISVLGIQRSALTYNMYANSNAVVDISGNLSENPVYIGDTVTLNLTGNFTQPVVNSLPVVDTSHFNKKPGVKLTVYNSSGNQLNNSSLLGLSYEVDGITYYPRMDGSVRIALADRVANIFKRIKINTQNVNLVSGSYTLRIESFTSPDGIYYGHVAQDTLDIPFTVINSTYGLKVKLTDNEMMIDKTMGYTLNNNNLLNFSVEYNSTFVNPNIHVKLYRRDYDHVDSSTYSEVDLRNYITNELVPISGMTNEYMFIDTPVHGMTKTLYLKTLLTSGTYKFVFSLYDGTAFIGDMSQYIIIK